MGIGHLNLTTLMESDAAACEYYNSLPEHIKEKIKNNEDNITSLEALKDFAQNLFR